MKQISTDGKLESNFEKLHENLIEKGTNQMVVLVVGPVNTAKTSFSLMMDYYLNEGDVDLDSYALNHEQFIDSYTSRPLKKTIVYEEGRDSFYRRKAMTSKNKEALNSLQQYRKFQHTVFINFQNARDLEPDLVLGNIAHALIRCTSPGRVWGYSRKSMQKMWTTGGKFDGWDKPDFKDGFKNPEKVLPELWDSYEKKAIEELDSREVDPEDADNFSSEGDPSKYLRTGEVAEMFSVHPDTVRRWCENGTLDYIRLPNNERRIKESSVNSIIES